MFGKSSVFTQTQLYKCPKHSDVFIFNWSRYFFVKIQKFWGAPIETSDFLQICADFDRIWHKHAGLRPAYEDRANTRKKCEQKTLKKQVVRKIVRNRAKRAKIRAKKNLEKADRAKIVRNRAKRAKIRAKKTLKKQFVRKSCENPCEKTIMRTFHPNSTLRRNFTKNPQFCPKICTFKFLTENRMGLRKKPKHFSF